MRSRGAACTGLAAGLALALAAAAAEPAPGASEAAGSERERVAARLAERAEAGEAEAIAALIPLLHDPSSRIRYHAEWGLARAGEPAVPGLVAELRRRRDDEGRARVAGALGRIGLAARAAVPELLAALADPDSRAAGQAACALGSMRAREAVPELAAAYARSRDVSNQREMARALRAIGSDQGARDAKARLVASLAAALERGDASARAAAVEHAAALHRAARDDADNDFPTREELRVLVPGLVAALDDPDPERVAAATRVLALAGRDAAAAAPRLEAFLGDPRTHGPALAALRAIASPEAERILAERRAFEALEARIRSDFSVRDHQGHTRLLPFPVADADSIRLSASFHHPGREPRAPRHVVVALESFSAQPRFAQARELVWIADGSAIRMGGLERSASEAQQGGVIEELSGLLSVREFLAIARARTLRGRIGPVEFSLEESERAALAHFAARIPPAPGVAPSP
jgi:HEAT repeat protein